MNNSPILSCFNGNEPKNTVSSSVSYWISGGLCQSEKSYKDDFLEVILLFPEKSSLTSPCQSALKSSGVVSADWVQFPSNSGLPDAHTLQSRHIVLLQSLQVVTPNPMEGSVGIPNHQAELFPNCRDGFNKKGWLKDFSWSNIWPFQFLKIGFLFATSFSGNS